MLDLIQFLISRGHGKHVPPGGPDQFPEAVLNGGKLDLYNLYKEVRINHDFFIETAALVIDGCCNSFFKLQHHSVLTLVVWLCRWFREEVSMLVMVSTGKVRYSQRCATTLLLTR